MRGHRAEARAKLASKHGCGRKRIQSETIQGLDAVLRIRERVLPEDRRPASWTSAVKPQIAAHPARDTLLGMPPPAGGSPGHSAQREDRWLGARQRPFKTRGEVTVLTAYARGVACWSFKIKGGKGESPTRLLSFGRCVCYADFASSFAALRAATT